MTTTSKSSPDIRRPEALDAAWFTRVLQSAGVDAVVRSFTAKGVGTGQIGDSVRFRLDYERGGEGAPATLVGKFPAADASSFDAGVSGGNYVREVMFYRNLASTARIATPRCYVAEADEASGEFVLMMEDLAPAEQGDQLAGVTIDQARLATDEAAKLHASYWGDEAMNELPWVVGSRQAPTNYTRPEASLEAWRAFRDRYDDRLAPEVIEAGALIAERITRFRALGRGPRCLIHQDFRPDNMMFATPAGGRPITVLDWQSIGLGAGPLDLGYFLAGALSPEDRRAHEAELLARYHAGLTRLGVSGYSADDLKADYAKGGMHMLMIVFVSSIRVRQTARGDDMFMQMARSAAAHIHDNDALSLLD